MQRLMVAVSAFAAMAAAPPASAAADKAGAEAILRDYAAIFGKIVDAKGLVSVTPSGADYQVAWHLQKLFDMMRTADFKGEIKAGDYVYRLTPSSPDGWTASANLFPALSFKGATKQGVASGAINFRGFAFSGAYAPDKPDFHHSTTSVDSAEMNFEIPDPKAKGTISVVESGLAIETQAKTAADGSVDAAFAQKVKSIVEKIHVQGETAGDFTFTTGESGAAVTIEGLRSAPFMELWRWTTANAAAPPTPATQAGFKTRAAAMLPLWNAVKADADIADMKFASAFGDVGVKSLRQTFRFSGFDHLGVAEVGWKVEGLTASSPLMPHIADEFLPAALDLDMKISVEGVDEMARAALDDPNFQTQKPLSQATQDKIAAIAKRGSPKLVVAPGHFTTPAIDLAFEGEMALQDPVPTAHFVVKAKNFDKSVELAGKIGALYGDPAHWTVALAFVKGLAKDGDEGQLVWSVDLSADGKVKVNGQEMPTDK